ncbi:MAG: hypothetical protein AAGG75_11255 [Bacteroidota bacterium]
MDDPTILEVTTFNINSTVNPIEFAQRDVRVESDFTSQQPGFIKRQSGVNDQGEYVVLVYWKSAANADASMNKFMGDASVADYAQMIDASTMKMARYAIDTSFKAGDSGFVEVMSFDVKPETDLVAFHALNQKVETDFTSKREGFLQRLMGKNESGQQLVAVYWADKATSDAALKPFMAAPIAKEFMQHMDQASIHMGRYELLNKK